MKEPEIKQILMGQIPGDWRRCIECRRQFLAASLTPHIKCPECKADTKFIKPYNKFLDTPKVV